MRLKFEISNIRKNACHSPQPFLVARLFLGWGLGATTQLKFEISNTKIFFYHLPQLLLVACLFLRQETIMQLKFEISSIKKMLVISHHNPCWWPVFFWDERGDYATQIQNL